MEFNREEVYEFLKTPKHMRREMDDPLSVVGKKVPSTHCKGKKEKVLNYFYGRFSAVCDCGWTLERHVGSRSWNYGFSRDCSVALEKYLKRPEVKSCVDKLRAGYTEKPRRPIRIDVDLDMHGRIVVDDVPLVSPEIRKDLAEDPANIFDWDRSPWLLDEFEEWLESKKSKKRNKRKRGN